MAILLEYYRDCPNLGIYWNMHHITYNNRNTRILLSLVPASSLSPRFGPKQSSKTCPPSPIPIKHTVLNPIPRGGGNKNIARVLGLVGGLAYISLLKDLTLN